MSGLTGTASALWRRYAHDDRGGVALEFAIVAMAFIMGTLALIEFGRALQARNELAFAADFGARQILVDPTIDETTITNAIRAKFDGSKPDSLTVEVGNENVGGDEFRTLELSYPLTLTIPGTHGALELRISRRVPKI